VTDTEKAAVVALGWGRVALGAAMVAMPRLLLRQTFLGRSADPVAVAITRGFGARDIAVGAGILWAHQSGEAEARRRWYLVGAGCDAVDALAMLKGSGVPRTGRMLWTLAAGSAVALGIAAARRA
jgi:hypothetical protein